jgi:hypothetical protein
LRHGIFFFSALGPLNLFVSGSAGSLTILPFVTGYALKRGILGCGDHIS